MQRPESPVALDEGPRKDKNYRRYASNVERALSLFDTALQEWADYIAFLGRLLKALQTRPSDVVEIPHRSTVAKRLAQCLAPTLPSGVHQKTLEVYAYVFSVLGKDGLSRDLSLWLPGLSPTLSFASLSIKPLLLRLFETFIVPLDPKVLRSALKAILLALLPGLEEETSEEFERSLSIINKFKYAISQVEKGSSSTVDITGDQYFWQSLFLASITSGTRRQGALAFLSRELPVLGSMHIMSSNADNSQEAQHLPSSVEAVTSPEPGLLVRCFTTGLQDEQLLIQRGFLDLLLTHLPLHSPIFQTKVSATDLELLILAAVSVVARRDMSLNRRLWSWLLGPERTADKDDSAPSTPSSPTTNGLITSNRIQNLSQTGYFEKYGLNPLVKSIFKILESSGLGPSERARPFRVCLSLMDRWEIGGLVIPRVFLPAIESIWKYQKIAPSKDALAEVLRSANVFFDGIESGLIWAELIQILIRALDSRMNDSCDESKTTDKTSLDSETLLDIVAFVIAKFNLREDEMLNLHIPLAAVAMSIMLRESLEKDKTSSSVVWAPPAQAFKISAHFIDAIPLRVFQTTTPSQEYALQNSVLEQLEDVQLFYQQLRKGSEDVSPPIQMSAVGAIILQNVSLMVIRLLSASPAQIELLERVSNLLEKSLHKMQGLDRLKHDHLISCIEETSENLASDNATDSFYLISALVSLLQTIKSASSLKAWDSEHRVRRLLPRLLAHLWEYTSPSNPKHNVEAVRCLWQIHWISPDRHLVEGSTSTLLLDNDTDGSGRSLDIESARRFTIVWAHSQSTTYSSSSQRSKPRRDSAPLSSMTSVAAEENFLLERPLFLLLDSLHQEGTELSMFVCSWLQSLSSLQKIVDIIVTRLYKSSFLKAVMFDADHPDRKVDENGEEDVNDVGNCQYYLSIMVNLIKYSGASIWAALGNPTDVKDTGTVSEDSGEKAPVASIQLFLAKACISILESRWQNQGGGDNLASLRKTVVDLLHLMLIGKFRDSFQDMTLDHTLLKTLSWSIRQQDFLLQVQLMGLMLTVLQAKSAYNKANQSSHRRQVSLDKFRSVSQTSLSMDQNIKDHLSSGMSTSSPKLLDCLIQGISSTSNHPILEQWISFMNQCLPLYADSAFQNLMPLVDCFIQVFTAVFEQLRAPFKEEPSPVSAGQCDHIAIINVLLNGLEQVLARGHDQLLQDEGRAVPNKSPEQGPGFFGNIVSGVLALEAHKSRAATANNRLTVLLCFKDAVRASFGMWSWADTGSGISSSETLNSPSYAYTSLRLRNRSRRILEHLLAAEVLECLETLVEIWHHPNVINANSSSNTIFNLLHAMEGSRPKNTIPALFNAIYSRTNPNVLDPARKSSLTSELSDLNLATFLVAYTQSMEDDALDEIWTDCMTFLRDVLGNPLPHRQTLPLLLHFTAILAEKINNTNFGEQRKMRRDIGELFIRLLAALFTIKPLAFPHDLSSIANGDDPVHKSSLNDPNEVVSVIASILPNISKVLVDSDRLGNFTTILSTQILLPTFRWKGFPRNVTESTLQVLKIMSKIPEASKIWRKDIAEAFNDSRFFHTDSLDLVQKGWIPVLRQWTILDKDRMADLLSRFSSPTSAGIMFGVGASSARQDADRKAQLNLRRVALLVLSADHDTFVVNLGSLQEKLVDLMTATAASSPSSLTRAEIYMVLRSLVQRITPVHLASLWPIVNSELYEALSSLSPVHASDKFSVASVLQAAKLLETLLMVAPDDFQLREWLFITDTIDAVYRPPDWRPTALVDELAEVLDANAGMPQSAVTPFGNSLQSRQLSLTWDATQGVPKEKIVDQVIRPFLRQLSITAFESTYRMEKVDMDACSVDLLQDLFDETTLV
ncbi:hypothetical protein ACLMJK_007883 [Lecanora helva]